jgi:enoyl-CoA hydratase/carnithine racemase
MTRSDRFDTLRVRQEEGVVFADIAAPPMNLLGPELVRDLVLLIERAEADEAVRVSAIFCQFEPAFGQIPGGGGAQHLTRLMGRARALEVMLSAQDYDAEIAERYGWINRALPAEALGDFVSSLARRIASFPAAGHAVVKDRVNAIALAPVEDFRRDSDLFGEGVRVPAAQELIAAAMKRSLQTRDAELRFADVLGD